MAKNLISKKLEPMVGHDIIVVTSDGGAYLGILDEFDDHYIVLKDTYESSTTTAWRWQRPVIESPILINNSNGFEEESESKRIVLKEVMISLQHVVRIWPINETFR